MTFGVWTGFVKLFWPQNLEFIPAFFLFFFNKHGKNRVLYIDTSKTEYILIYMLQKKYIYIL